MQLELTPERLDQRRERTLVTCLGPLEVDGHRVNDTRSVGNGPAVRFAASRCLLRPHDHESEMSRSMTDRSTNQAETRRKASSTLARMFAVWRTGLPRPVLVLQGGNALNYFGTGLILPFEIIYLHAVRGFSTATAGLVLATIMGTAAVVTLPSGALLDRFSAKRIL